MGTYSRLIFENATFNEGALYSNTVDGFFTVLWDPIQWSGTIYFYTKNMPMTHLTFGASATASTGFDSAIDLIHPPPPISDIDAWFELDDPEYPSITKLDRDFRYYGDTLVVWEGNATYGTAYDTVLVYWNPMSLPDGLFMLDYESPDGEVTLDMKSDTTFFFTDSTHFTITFFRGALQRQSIGVCSGWNMLSLPILPTGSSRIREIVPGAITDGYWYNPLHHGYDVLMSPAAGKAFWVYVLGDGEVEIAGMNVPQLAVHLYRGWNMVGVPYSEEGYILVDDITSIPEGSILYMFSYDACGTGSYYPVGDTLYVGRGYWFFATNECNLMIGDGLLKSSSHSPQVSFTIHTDDIPLTLGIDKLSSNGIDEWDVPIPPTPPNSDISFPTLIVEDERLIREVNPDGEFTIYTEIGERLSWNPKQLPQEYKFTLLDGSESIDMSEMDNWTVNNKYIEIIGSKLPDRIALLPNRPNPFNAYTEIAFTLPQGQDVNMELYDLTGCKIRNLYEGYAPSGTNKIIWNGTDNNGNTVSSGIYFVRLVVGENTFTRKITLLK